MDIVSFTPNPPWPTDANGTGFSIELVNPLSDNNSGINWKSGLIGGTPGTKNFKTVISGTPGDLPLSGCNLTCFPNPFHDYTTVRIEVSVPGRYKIEIFNIQGQLMNVLANQTIEAGTYYLDWEGRTSNNGKLPGGVYIIRLSGEKQYYNFKAIILK